MNGLWLFAAVALCGYLLAVFVLWRFQDRFIFPSYRSRRLKLDPAPSELQMIHTAQDGTALEGFWLKNQSDRLLVWFDGNSDNVNALLPEATNRFKNLDLLALNYRGYGQSGGQPSQDAILSDALDIYDTYASNYHKVYLLGRSLGSGVASFLAGQRPASGLILITPFRSIRDLAQARFPLIPIGFLVRHPFESWRYLQTSDLPVALLGVKKDRITPEKQAQALKKHIHSLVHEEWLEGTTHAEVINHPRYFDFIEESLGLFDAAPKS